MHTINVTALLCRSRDYNSLCCQNAVKRHKTYINMLGGMFANHSRWFGIPKDYTFRSRRALACVKAKILSLGVHKPLFRSLKTMPMR